MLDNAKLNAFKKYVKAEPLHVDVSSGAGGVEAAMHAILVALGRRLPIAVPPTPQPPAEPLEELVLELSDLKFQEQDGVRRASALAELVYEPATPGKEKVASENSWRLVAPIGPIELEEIRWYLGRSASAQPERLMDRDRKVEESLKEWGRADLLFAVAFPKDHVGNVREAWAKLPADARRRFSVFVKSRPEAGQCARTARGRS